MYVCTCASHGVLHVYTLYSPAQACMYVCMYMCIAWYFTTIHYIITSSSLAHSLYVCMYHTHVHVHRTVFYNFTLYKYQLKPCTQFSEHAQGSSKPSLSLFLQYFTQDALIALFFDTACPMYVMCVCVCVCVCARARNVYKAFLEHFT